MFEARPKAEGVPYRTRLLKTHAPEDIQKNDLAAKLLGIKDYED